MSRHELSTDDRRRGGEASGEARRKRKLRSWQDEFLEAVEADPRAFVAGLLRSSNGAAKVRALELATAWKRAHLLEREHALRERERKVSERERSLADYQDWAEEAERDIGELERQRDELRAAFAAEAEEHDMELVDDAVA
jgi:hypothetical protein